MAQAARQEVTIRRILEPFVERTRGPDGIVHLGPSEHSSHKSCEYHLYGIRDLLEAFVVHHDRAAIDNARWSRIEFRMLKR